MEYRLPWARDNARSVFFPSYSDGFLQDFNLHGLFAQKTLQFTYTELELFDFRNGNNTLVGADSHELQAKMRLEKMRLEGLMLSYIVAGHAQNGVNWRIREMCHVVDEVAEVDEVYLIKNRTFELSRQEDKEAKIVQGAITKLELCPPERFFSEG